MTVADRQIINKFFADLQTLLEDAHSKRTTDISYVRTQGARLVRDAVAQVKDNFTMNCVFAVFEEFHKELDTLDPLG